MATRNRYAEIMAQYAQSQPFSFFGYPQGYTGGYDVTPVQVSAAPATLYEEIMAQPGMGGGRMTQVDEGVTWSEPTSEQAYNWSKAGENLRFISPITGALLGAYGNYLARNVNPNYSNEGRNYTGGFLGSDASANAESSAVSNGGNVDTSNYSNEGRNVDTSNYSNEGRSGRGGEGGGGGYAGAPSGGSDVGRSAPGSAHYAQGGHVSMQHLLGPDPAGADDGYGALKDGEFVINDKAVKKYGIELMHAINSGKISKGKLRGLLEM